MLLPSATCSIATHNNARAACNSQHGSMVTAFTIAEHVYALRDARDTQHAPCMHHTPKPRHCATATCIEYNAACSMQPVKCSMQHAACKMQCATCSVQHAASYSLHNCNVQHVPTAPATGSMHAHRVVWCATHSAQRASAAQRARRAGGRSTVCGASGLRVQQHPSEYPRVPLRVPQSTRDGCGAFGLGRVQRSK